RVFHHDVFPQRRFAARYTLDKVKGDSSCAQTGDLLGRKIRIPEGRKPVDVFGGNALSAQTDQLIDCGQGREIGIYRVDEIKRYSLSVHCRQLVSRWTPVAQRFQFTNEIGGATL